MRPHVKTALVVAWNIAAVVALFAGAEFIARVIQFHRHGRDIRQPLTLRDRYAVWRTNPSYTDGFIRNNHQGFRRDEDTPLDKAPNSVRIFIVGGSVAYGIAGNLFGEVAHNPAPPRNSETISYYLERELNARYPSRHWEVINAGVPAYRLHQDLARLLSVVLRYRPDYVISIDGVNDMESILSAPVHYDPYLVDERMVDFDELANPAGFTSLRVLASNWLRRESALAHSLQDWIAERRTARYVARTALPDPLKDPVRWEDLTAEQQRHYRGSAAQLDAYARLVRQIHAILAVDHVEDLFVLQPHLATTHKPLTGTEPVLNELTRRRRGNLYVYGFATLYPRLADTLSADAPVTGYRFLNTIGAFDGMRDQAYTDFCHLTPQADRVIADRILDSLRDSFAHAADSPPADSASGFRKHTRRSTSW